MILSYLHAPRRRINSKHLVTLLGVAAFAACSSPEASRAPHVGAGGSSGGGGLASSGSGGGGGTSGSLGSGGTLGAGGSGGTTGGSGGTTGGSGGSGGTSGGSGGTAGTAGSTSKGGTAGTGGMTPADELTGCEELAGGAGGDGGASGGGAGGAGGAGEPSCLDNPISLKTSWVATASHTGGADVPAKAVDADANSRFTTGKDQDGDEWLQIDFGAPVTLSRVEFTSSNDDYPAGFEIRVSNVSEDSAATVIASGVGATSGENSIERCFEPVVGQYLLISQTGTSSHWWSVTDLNVSCQ
jgi:hypothetical protein